MTLGPHTHIYRPDRENPGQERCLTRWGPCDAPARPTPAPAQGHSATSQEAARRIEPVAGTLRAQVLEVHRVAQEHGLTDGEGIEVTGLDPSTYRPRRVELVDAGLVFDSGTTRPTKAGRDAVVWRATVHNPNDLSTDSGELSTLRPQPGRGS